jgi:hypothetical protein
MNNRSASSRQQKTYWTIMANFIANCSPSKLLVTYLAVYAQLSAHAFANAQASVETDSEATYLRAWNKLQYKADSSECVKVAATCVLTAEPYGNSRTYDIRQSCGEDAQAVRSLSLDAQLALDQFVGSQFCNGVVSTVKAVNSGSVEDSIDLSRVDSKIIVKHKFFKSVDQNQATVKASDLKDQTQAYVKTSACSNR